MRLLIVEDEKDLRESVAEGLKIDGYYVDMAEDGESALDLLSYNEYDLIVLDLNLPDMHGFEILNYVNENWTDTKVLILTANVNIETKVDGFDLGASDYLTKPFHFQELEVRIKALLRRKFYLEKSIISCGDLDFDSAKRVVLAKGKEISLTKKETAIIEYLFFNKDKIVSSEDLIAHAWDDNVDYFSNSIRVHLTSLRKKLKNVLGYNPIINKIGEGYYLKR